MGFVEKFLFFIELKWGVVIVGFVDIILSILCGCFLPWMQRAMAWEYFNWTAAKDSFFQKSISDIYFNRFGYSMYVFLLVILVLHIVACILLIVSAHAEDKIMIAPYIATSLMRFVLLLLILIWIVTKSYDCTTSYCLIGLSLVTSGYFWLTAVSWLTANA